MLLGPAVMMLVYVGQASGKLYYFSRGFNENIALILVGVSLSGFLFQTLFFRSELSLFMTLLCGAFFCREWHFYGTSNGVYVALGFLGFWAYKRKDNFLRIIGGSYLKVWLFSTFWTYLLSQLIARRLFRYLYLPLEDNLHIYLEESLETTAHLMMIATCVICFLTILKQNKK
jgi:hypothetical protein